MTSASSIRCAVYARYSSDQQRDASLDDQIRKCRQFAEGKGWTVVPAHIYRDQALSGASSDRPGLKRLLDAAFSQSRPFDVVLIDDTSRLSRRLVDVMEIQQRLQFDGVRLVAVSQGIDSNDEQADVMFTVHGLVDSLYLKELGKKTFRGLEGLALAGYHTGGNCLGYRSEQENGGTVLRIAPSEATLVRRIFQMYADGLSYKRIARQLNEQRVPAPRGSGKNPQRTWTHTTVREILRRELYIGKVVWGKKKYVKRPGSNKRIARKRPESEWTLRDVPELRIVPADLWNSVQDRITAMNKKFPGSGPGLLSRSSSVKYLLSGFLKCGECGANMVIASGRGSKEGAVKYYGCSHALSRGTCKNRLLERMDVIEEKLLAGLQQQLATPDVIEYVVDEIIDSLQRPADEDGSAVALRAREGDLRKESENLAAAIAKSGSSKQLLQALRDREKELTAISRQLKIVTAQKTPVPDRTRLRQIISAEIAHIPALFRMGVERARAELLKHVEEVRMCPVEQDGKRFYVAEGEWDITGLDPQKSKVAGAELNGDFRLVAGGGFEPPTFGL